MGRPRLHEHCTIGECRGRHIARGMCSSHYNEWKRTADPSVIRERIMAGDDPTDPAGQYLSRWTREDGDCLVWTASYRSWRGQGVKDIPQISPTVSESHTLNARVVLWNWLHPDQQVAPPNTVRSLPDCQFGCVKPEHLVVEPIYGGNRKPGRVQ